MHISEILIAGDVPGHDWRLPVIHFAGRGKGPKTYIQAALHAGELPGVAAAHYLAAHLRAAEARGEILGDITLVPQANPIGTAQWLNGEMQGRFDFASRINFNRGYPMVSFEQRSGLTHEIGKQLATTQLKRHLLSMAIDADIVLDLHCDDQSLQYGYIHPAFWPEAADLAAAMDFKAVFLSDGADDSFEEAVGMAWLKPQAGTVLESLPGKLSVTVELRGIADVDPALAQKDAFGIVRFLQGRGVLGGTPIAVAAFTGPVVPLDHVEMVRAPAAGTVLFYRDIGDRVKEGDLLARLICAPGQERGTIDVHAPQDGLIVTRVTARYVRRTDNLIKMACAAPTREARAAGALED